MGKKDLLKLEQINELKKVERSNPIQGRKESAAEHSWSCLVTADYFLERTEKDLDELEVYRHLIYHDLHEVEAGDTPLKPGNEVFRDRDETECMEKFAEQLPRPISSNLRKYFIGFEKLETKEAKFARAIDSIDPVINMLYDKGAWEGWSEEFLRKHKTDHFKGFPVIMEAFEHLVDILKENGCL